MTAKNSPWAAFSLFQASFFRISPILTNLSPNLTYRKRTIVACRLLKHSLHFWFNLYPFTKLLEEKSVPIVNLTAISHRFRHLRSPIFLLIVFASTQAFLFWFCIEFVWPNSITCVQVVNHPPNVEKYRLWISVFTSIVQDDFSVHFTAQSALVARWWEQLPRILQTSGAFCKRTGILL